MTLECARLTIKSTQDTVHLECTSCELRKCCVWPPGAPSDRLGDLPLFTRAPGFSQLLHTFFSLGFYPATLNIVFLSFQMFSMVNEVSVG